MDIIGDFEATKPTVPCLKTTLLSERSILATFMRHSGKSPPCQKAYNHHRTRRYDILHTPGFMKYESTETQQQHSFIHPHQRHRISSGLTAAFQRLQCLMNTCIVCIIPLLTPLKRTCNTADRLILAAKSARVNFKQKLKNKAPCIIQSASNKLSQASNLPDRLFNESRLLQSGVRMSTVPLFPGLHGSAIGPPAAPHLSPRPLISNVSSWSRDSSSACYTAPCASSATDSFLKKYLKSECSTKTDAQQLAFEYTPHIAVDASKAPRFFRQQTAEANARARAIAASAHVSASSPASASQYVRRGLVSVWRVWRGLVSFLGSFVQR